MKGNVLISVVSGVCLTLMFAAHAVDPIIICPKTGDVVHSREQVYWHYPYDQPALLQFKVYISSASLDSTDPILVPGNQRSLNMGILAPGQSYQARVVAECSPDTLITTSAIISFTGASDTTTIRSDAARVLHLDAGAGPMAASGLPAGDGETVDQWLDQTTSQTNASSNTGTPIYLVNQIAGLPAVSFDTAGGDSLIFKTGDFDSVRVLPDDFSCFAVANFIGTQNNYQSLLATRDDSTLGGAGYQFGCTQYAAAVHLRLQLGGTRLNGQTAGRPNVWQMIDACRQDGKHFAANDGVKGVTTVMPAYNVGTRLATLGSINNGGDWMRGMVAEVIVYRGAISESDRAGVRRYLADKYALPGYTGDYPTIAFVNPNLATPNGSITTFTVKALSPIGAIANVEFFVNGVPAGLGVSDGAGNYSCAITAPATGANYQIAAIGANDETPARKGGDNIVIWSSPIYVDVTPAGAGDGSSWANATSFSQAMDMVTSAGSGMIYMASGAYDVTTMPVFDKPMILSIYGGFIPPADKAARDAARSWETNPTTVSGQNLYSIFNFGTAGFEAFILDGVTIANAASPANGAVINAGPSAAAGAMTISNCIFTSNTSYGAGSGIIYLAATGTSATIAQTRFDGNRCGGYAGVMELNGGVSVNLTQCVFSANRGYNGGAIRLESGATLNASQCVFADNTTTIGLPAAGDAGVILLWNGNLTVSQCLFTSNSSYRNGGAIYINNAAARATITNSIFANNSAVTNGGAIGSANHASLSVINCTFYGNRAQGRYNGMANTDGIYISVAEATVNVLNCLFDDHSAAFIGVMGINMGQMNNCLFGLQGSGGIANAVIGGNPVNCISDSSLLVNPAGDDYSLRNDSPAINAGALSAGGYSAPAIDYPGNPRSPNPDIGAYENLNRIVPDPHTPPTSYTLIRVALGGVGTGTNWGADVANLDWALANVAGNGQIWIKAGEYSMPVMAVVANPVSIFGGFAGTEASPAARTGNYALDNATTISGIGADRILAFIAWSPAVAIDAVNFFNGSAAGYGGAIYSEVDLALSQCSFTSNACSQEGGAVFVNNGAAVSVTSCAFSDNTAVWRGGALSGGMLAVQTVPTTITVIGSMFLNNHVTITGGGNGGGGAICREYLGAMTLENCVFDGNDSGLNGGAVRSIRNGAVNTARDCKFYNNMTTSGDGGGAMRLYRESWILTNCEFSSNSAIASGNYYGGAIWTNSDEPNLVLTLDGCVFTSNSGGYGGAVGLENGNQNSVIPTFTNCEFTRNTALQRGGAIWRDANNYLIPMAISDCSFDANTANASQGGAIYNYRSSSALNRIDNCFFTGNSAPNSDGGAVWCQYGQLSFTTCTFSLNRCKNYGGAIRDETGLVNLVNCGFDQNSGGADGGTVKCQNASIYATDTTFTNNTAGDGGAAVNSYCNTAINPTASFLRCTFTNNQIGNGGDPGGALFFNWGGQPGTITINLCDFVNNKVTGTDKHGGALAFNNAPSGATISDCSFTSNSVAHGWGGAIYATSNFPLTLERTTFTGNSTAGHDGGAIGSDNAGCRFQITDCDFINNTSPYGGALRPRSTPSCVLENCLFSGNTSNNGGVIYSTEVSEVYDMRHCRFLNNYCSGNGGAIYSTAAGIIMRISDTSFTGNYATASGGAMRPQGTICTLSNCLFENNQGQNGGAIYNDSTASNCEMRNCQFFRNIGYNGDGGALRGKGAFVMDACMFEGNRCSDEGGVMYIREGSANITSTTFTDNATTGNNGGAVWFSLESASVTSCSFANNTAGNPARKSGGAMFVDNSSTVTIDRCDFAQNNGDSGGAIYVKPYIMISSTDFIRNNAASNGGAVRHETTTCTLDNCLFDGNQGTNGGALYGDSVNGVYAARNCQFLRNVATTGDGGAVRIKGALVMEACVLEGNRGYDEGGAAYVREGSAAITSTTFTDNATTNNTGGALWFYSDSASVTSCSFVNNAAGNPTRKDGGAVDVGSGAAGYYLLMDRCLLSGNAGWDGGAMRVRDANTSATIINSVFLNNSGPSGSGGGIRRESTGNLAVVNCTFYGNRSLNGEGIHVDNTGNPPNIFNCIFDNHTRAFNGGAGTLDRCLFGNTLTNTVTNATVTNPIPADFPVSRVDPLFVDALAGNVDLQPGSPAVDQGYWNSATGLNAPIYDIANRRRDYPGASPLPDVGAYELFQGILIITPNPLDFGSVAVGSSVTGVLTLQNNGNAPIVADTSDYFVSGAPFGIDTPNIVTLQPGGASEIITLRFNPLAPGDYTGAFTYDDGVIAPINVALLGATPPEVFSVVRLSPSPTTATTVEYLVTYSQPVTNVDVDDFTTLIVSGTFTAAPQVIAAANGTTATTVTVATGTGEGEFRLDVTTGGATAIADARYSQPLMNLPFSGEVYQVDTVPPMATTLAPRWIGPAPTSTTMIYDLLFSEPVTGLTSGAFTVSLVNGSASGELLDLSNPSGDRMTWTVTVGNLASGAPLGGMLRLDMDQTTSVTDDLGNPLAAKFGGVFAADTVAPNFNPLADVTPTSGMSAAIITTVTITFTEPVFNVTADKLTLTTDGINIYAALAVLNPSGDNQTFEFKCLDVFGEGPIPVNIALIGTSGTVICDQAYIPFIEQRWSVIKDATLLPITEFKSVQVASGAITSQTPVLFTVTFGIAVENFVTSDLSVANCLIVPVSWPATGATYTFNAIPTAQGLVTLFIPSNVCNSAVDPKTRQNEASRHYSFLFDNLPPEPLDLSVTPTYAQEGVSVSIVFTASEALAHNPDVTVNDHTASLVRITSGAYTYSYTTLPADAEGWADVAITLTDLIYNVGVAHYADQLYVDRTPPIAAIAAVGDYANAVTTVTFSEAVTGVDLGDFVLTRNGSVVAELSNLTQVDPSHYTLVIGNAAPGVYVLRLVAAGSGINDLAGLPLGTDAETTWMIYGSASAVQLWTRY
ncbi:MAG: hypothetical protein NTX50_23905 [Candidatus Sumerlaeota bacterium]|nr:hypothetical protein [Candidatus Sumerlaeota bacterium]